MPVSMTYAVTPAPVAVYWYMPSSVRDRWSILSSPHVASVWVSASVATESGAM